MNAQVFHALANALALAETRSACKTKAQGTNRGAEIWYDFRDEWVPDAPVFRVAYNQECEAEEIQLAGTLLTEYPD